MAYRIHGDQRVRDDLARIAQEQLGKAERELRTGIDHDPMQGSGIDHDPVQAVHSARKAVKKERALLRLVSNAIPGSVRRRENVALRDAARQLSGTRDAEVLVEALDDLHERYAGQVPLTAFTAFRDHLVQERNAARAQLADPHLAPHVADELHSIRERIDGLHLKNGGWKAIGPGLGRSYKRGRKAFTQARVRRDDESLHEWRKRAKDLWYQLRLIAPVCGQAVRGEAKEAHVLSDLLGDDHDLAVLRGALIDHGTEVAADLDALLGLIDHRRHQLQSEGVLVGTRIYAESPKAFSRRMHRRWRAGRAQARRPQNEDPAELAQATRTVAMA
jgi:CHAD domain-containing protein